ncbi:MAG TPA: LamG domain-containing protein [Candidatus Kapabacteria bacterium]|nr:LamG domain-containing protein [Candidatus Kapabacteria bacterium]
MKKITLSILLLAALGLSACKDSLPPAPTTSSSGLVAWYKLDQNTADSSGNHHDGVAQGGNYVPDRFGGAQSAMKLDGASFVSVIDAPDLNFDSLASFSVSVWIKTADTASTYRGIISKGPVTGALPGYALGMDKDGKVLATISGDRNPAMRSTSSVNDNKWHLISVSVEANTLAALFIDGSLEASFPLTTFYANKNNSAYLFIGKDRTSSGFFTGVIDDIRIYSKALLPADIMMLFTAGGWLGDTTTTPVDTSTGGGPATYGTNTITNPSFRTTVQGPGYIDNTTFPPWDVAYGSPRFSSGNGQDSIPGYAYLWGTVDDGNAIWQPLSTPIKQGHTYHVSFYTRSNSNNQDFHNQQYVIIRCVAFNAMPGGMHWSPSPGNVSVMGKFTSTKMDVWTHVVTADWTADADYANFEIDVSTLVSGLGNESWASIDVVSLQEKQ